MCHSRYYDNPYIVNIMILSAHDEGIDEEYDEGIYEKY
jgi:hypothetical protein